MINNEYVLERYLASSNVFTPELTENEVHILANIVAHALSFQSFWESPVTDTQYNTLSNLYGKLIEELTA